MHQVHMRRVFKQMLQFLSKKLSTGFLGNHFVNTSYEKISNN